MGGLLILNKSPLGESTSIPSFNIPLMIRGDKVGLVEAIVINTDEEFPKIMFAGTLIKELKNQNALVKLLQAEGIHLGKP